MVKFKDKSVAESKDNLVTLNTKSGTIKKKKTGIVTKKYLKNVTNFNRNQENVVKKETESDKIKQPSNSCNGFQVERKSENIQDVFSILWAKYKPRSTPHIKSRSDWTSEMLPEPEDSKAVPLITRKCLKELAERMYHDDLQAYRTIQEKRSGHSGKPFRKLILSHGTSRDKITELSFQCMDSPVYSLNDMLSLLDFIDPKYKNQCLEAIDNVINIFKSTLLPNEFVAKEFECHNFFILVPFLRTNMEQVEKQLILWYFEGQVQLAFIKFINNLEKICHDSRVSVKMWGINGLHKTLKSHPNQEIELVIRKLVNKLGDLNKKVAGNVLAALKAFQMQQPCHKVILVSLVEELLYRSNVSFRSQYYGLCCLENIIFTKHDQSLAERLVKLYFDFFKICANSGEVDSHFMGALLRGLNRAYPHLGGKKLSFLEDQVLTLYKLCHLVNFNVGTQALQLIYQVQSSTENEMSERFYSVLFRKILDRSFAHSSASGAFFNIIFKSLVRDTNVNRVRAFFRRLLQVCKYHMPHIIIAVLFLISEAIKDNHRIEGVAALLESGKAELSCKVDDGDDEYFTDLDVDDGAGSQQDTSSRNCDLITRRMETNHSSNSSPHNHARDSSKEDKKPFQYVNAKTESSWFHRENWKSFQNQHELRTNHYNPWVRNPSFAGANLSPIWELQDLEHHFHPTVNLFVSQLLDQRHIEYSGDPLQDFTLTRFLDRFVQRNPKKIDVQKDKTAVILGSRSCYIPRGSRNIPVQSKRFRSLKKSEVAVEDVVFHNYYTQYQNVTEKKEKKREDDEESVGDDEFDEYLKMVYRELGNEEEEAEDDLDFSKTAVAAPSAESEDDDDYEDTFEEESDMGEDEGGEDVANYDIDDTAFDVEEGHDDDSFADSADLADEEDWLEYNAPKKSRSKKLKSSSLRNWESMLVNADEFSQLLEKNTGDPLAGTSEELSNKDNSNVKQLMWEKKRRQKPFQPRSSTGGKRRKSISKTNFKGERKKYVKKKKRYSK